MPLLDQYGNPVKPAALNSERDYMGATLTGERPAPSEFAGMEGVTPGLLGGLLRNAADGNSSSWQGFCEILEERDPHYLSVLGTRKRVISQLPITVEDAGDSPEQKKQGDFIRAWLDKGIFQAAIFDILDAIAKGFSVHETEWHCETGNYYPKKLTWRPQRWFEISNQDGETLFVRDNESEGQVQGVKNALPELMRRPLDPLRAFVHRHPSWSGLLIRQGLARCTAFYSLQKMFSSRDWGLFVQAFGIPLRVGKFGSDATEKDRLVLKRAVADVAGAAGCIIPAGMELSFVEPKNGAGSNDTHERRCKWLDEQTSKVVLGQTGTTDARHGTHAAAVVHRQVQEDIERADAVLLAIGVNEKFVCPMIDLSFGPPGDGKYPLVRIGRPDEAPLELVISASEKLGPQGFKIRSDDLYSRLNLKPPRQGDEVVGITVQVPAPQPPSDKPAVIKPPRQNAAHIVKPTAQDPATGNQEQQIVQPEQQTLHSAISYLSARPEGIDSRIISTLSNSLANSAQSALNKMSSQVQEIVAVSSSYADLERRLKKLNLSGDDFADAMALGIACGQLAGQAAMLERMKGAQ